MMKFTPPPEPAEFDTQVRQPGQIWLQNHPVPKNPPKLWRQFCHELANYSGNLCNYSAMYEPNGTVDHYLSQKNYPHLIYEWSNYRYASGQMNAYKATQDNLILDPFEVNDDWFEIILPSLQLVMTEAVPLAERPRAKHTLEKLHLTDGESLLRQRQHWYKIYLETQNLELLAKHAPLIARAVKKQQAQMT